MMTLFFAIVDNSGYSDGDPTPTWVTTIVVTAFVVFLVREIYKRS